MKKIVGVRFKRLGKIYFFDPKWLEVQKGEYIIVETTQGEDIAEVIIPGRMIDEEKLNTPLKKVLRLASSKDLKHAEDLKKKEKEAFEYCNKKIKEYIEDTCKNILMNTAVFKDDKKGNEGLDKFIGGIDL